MENARRIWLERTSETFPRVPPVHSIPGLNCCLGLEACWELPPRWGLGTNPLGAHSRLEKASMQAAGEKSGCLPLDRSPPRGSDPLSVLLRTPLRSEIVQNTSRPGCLIDAESRNPWIRATSQHLPSRASIPELLKSSPAQEPSILQIFRTRLVTASVVTRFLALLFHVVGLMLVTAGARTSMSTSHAACHSRDFSITSVWSSRSLPV